METSGFWPKKGLRQPLVYLWEKRNRGVSHGPCRGINHSAVRFRDWVVCTPPARYPRWPGKAWPSVPGLPAESSSSEDDSLSPDAVIDIWFSRQRIFRLRLLGQPELVTLPIANVPSKLCTHAWPRRRNNVPRTRKNEIKCIKEEWLD